MTSGTSNYGPLWEALTDASRDELRELAHTVPPLPQASESLVIDLERANALFIGAAWLNNAGRSPMVGVVAPEFLEWIRATSDD